MNYPEPLMVIRLLEALIPATVPENYVDAEIPEQGEIIYIVKQLKEHVQLIAAAPELLEKIKQMVTIFNNKTDNIDPLKAFAVLDQAMGLIAKAEGRA